MFVLYLHHNYRLKLKEMKTYRDKIKAKMHREFSKGISGADFWTNYKQRADKKIYELSYTAGFCPSDENILKITICSELINIATIKLDIYTPFVHC